MPKVVQSDACYLHEFLDKLSDEERAILKHNLSEGVGLATPDVAVPLDGWG